MFYMALRTNALPVPTHDHLSSIIAQKRFISDNSDVNGGYIWNANNPQPHEPIENLTTAQVEYYFLSINKVNFVGNPPLFANRSRSVVKNSDDPFYSQNGYPNPPVGGIFRGISQDGSLGTGNFLEITPSYFIVKNAITTSNLELAEKIAQFIDWMTVDSSFFGTPIKLVAGIARFENGSWRKITDTVLLRNIAWAATAYYELFSATFNTQYRDKARNLLKTVALALNVNRNRVGLGEVPSFLAWAPPHAFVSHNSSHTLTWNRWTIEHMAAISLLLEKAISLEGTQFQVQDWQGNSVTLEQMASGLGSFVDAIFEYPYIMRDTNPNAPYLPYQFIFNQAWFQNPKYFVGVNFDWTEESGSLYSQSGWWIGDLELWGIWGMLILKRLGYTSSPVESFLWDWLRLPPGDYLWHDRYDFWGNHLDHDPSISTAFTALYGICLREGFSPQPPPPRAKYQVQSGGILTITTDKKSVIPIIRTPDGQVLQYSQIAPSPTTRGYVYRYELPSNLYYVISEETFSTDFMTPAP